MHRNARVGDLSTPVARLVDWRHDDNRPRTDEYGCPVPTGDFVRPPRVTLSVQWVPAFHPRCLAVVGAGSLCANGVYERRDMCEVSEAHQMPGYRSPLLMMPSLIWWPQGHRLVL